MATDKDQLPKSRTEQLAMADGWISVCATRQTDWNIPGPALTELIAIRDSAAAALETAKSETTRTPVSNARRKEAFDALTGFMRDFKRRHFLSPPLTDSDCISLGLKPRDPHPTPGAAPTAQAMAHLVGRRELGMRIVYVTGSPGDKANKGRRVHFLVVAQGEAPPLSPEYLRESFYAQRRKDLIEFGYEDSGKTVYFAVQIENDGKKGGWGPMVSALIP